MLAQLYLYDSLRTKFKDPYFLFIDTYKDKISPVFLHIEDEAKEIENEHYKKLGLSFNPDCDDEANCAQEAFEKGLDYYEGMSLMQYNTRLMYISTTYQFWEQQVRKFLFDEINHTHTFIDKHDKEIHFKSFCTRGIDDIKELFLWFNKDLTKLNSWKDINELRLLANVIKHGDGWSATELQKLRPDFFKDRLIKINLLELYKNTLTDIVLNVEDTDYLRYCNALIYFWDELPERLYSTSE